MSRIHSSLFTDWRCTVSSKFFETQVLSIFTEKLVVPRHARFVFSRLRCNGHSLLSLGLAEPRILLAAPADTRPRTPLISSSTVQLWTLCIARSLAALCFFTISGPGPGELPGFRDSMVFRHAPSLGRGRVTTTTSALKVMIFFRWKSLYWIF